jgi:hypothetical protein
MIARMKLADGIRKHGFCSWHERELLLSHGWLVLTLLLGFVAFGSLEAILSGAEGIGLLLSTVLMLVAGMGVIVTMHRFVLGLARTQKTSSQAVCSECEQFGQLRVIAEDREQTWVRVRCRGCGHEWVIEDDGVAQ